MKCIGICANAQLIQKELFIRAKRLLKRKKCDKVQYITHLKALMQINKRAIPSTPGGLLNKAFIYVPSASTDISVTFAKARAAQAACQPRPTLLLGGARA